MRVERLDQRGARHRQGTPAFADAIASVKAACESAGISPGFHQVAPDAAALRARIDEGYRFVAFGTDVLAIKHAFASIAALDR